jgi:integrase
MASDVKVWVVKRKDRNRYLLRYEDPVSGKRVTVTTDIALNQPRAAKLAQKAAGELQTQVHERVPKKADNTWRGFVDRYTREHLAARSSATRAKTLSVFRKLEAALPKLHRLDDVTGERLGTFANSLRSEGIRGTTVASYLGQLRAALRWAVKQGLLVRCPPMPTVEKEVRTVGAAPLRGRPLTQEEHQKIKDAATKYFGADVAPTWHRLLDGLLLSGLRLSEAVNLSWGKGTGVRVVVSEDGARCALHVKAWAQKNRKEQYLPITPPFNKWLLSLPLDDRGGHVFNVVGKRGVVLRDHERIGKLISRLGKLANVTVVDEDEDTASVGGEESRIKFASAHDYRRTFGQLCVERKVPREQLRLLMRHTSYVTTMRYYLHQEAESVYESLQGLDWGDGGSAPEEKPASTVS